MVLVAVAVASSRPVQRLLRHVRRSTREQLGYRRTGQQVPGTLLFAFCDYARSTALFLGGPGGRAFKRISDRHKAQTGRKADSRRTQAPTAAIDDDDYRACVNLCLAPFSYLI